MAAWVRRRLGVEVPSDAMAVCVGTKEFVATLPQWLKLRTPGRDTILYPAISYPTYEMGAILAGLRAVPVPVDADWRLDLSAVADIDAERALALWVNTPGNPAGQLDDLAGGGDRGGASGACRCSATSATPSSPGTARFAPSSRPACRASSPSTPSPSGPTWPVSGSGSTPATPNWSTTCGRCASTSA